MSNNYFKLFLITILVIVFTTCESSYLKYYAEDYCLPSNFDHYAEVINDSAINTSILIEDSRIDHKISNKTCAVRIVMPKKVDGFIIKVQDISINNTLSGKCDNFVQIGSSVIGKWCNSSEAKSLIFSNSSVDIVFNAQPYASLSFKIVVTPYENPIFGQFCSTSASFRCGQTDNFQCISQNFSCDGIENCASGFDEKDCTKVITVENNVENSVANATNNTIVEETQELPLIYQEYNILDYCNSGYAHEITLESSGTSSPAILVLSPNDTISNLTCVIKFSLPGSSWLSHPGLVLGIDDIFIQSHSNNSCDNYIQLSDSNIESQVKWCANKTNLVGKTFRGNGYLNILYHAGEHSASHFKLVLTPFEDTTAKFCFKSSELKCQGDEDLSCISKQYLCDGHNNCPTGYDEDGCTTPKPSTSTTTPTTTPTTTTTTTSTTTTTTTPKTTTTTPKTTTTAHSTTTPNTTPSTTPSPHPKGMGAGLIVLIVLGTAVAISAIVAVVWYCVKKRRENAGYRLLND